MRSLARPYRVAAFLFVVLAGQARAQEPVTLATLSPGDTVKVWAVAPRLNGTLGAFTSFRADTFTLGQLGPNPTAMVLASVPYASLRRVDVRRGLHRSGGRIVVGVLLGAAAGLVVGGPLGAWLECGHGCNEEFGGLAGFVVGSAVGVVGGGIGGGLLGARRTANWEYVSLQR
jgi:hypothetical protein